jgi:hypothetical protein
MIFREYAREGEESSAVRLGAIRERYVLTAAMALQEFCSSLPSHLIFNTSLPLRQSQSRYTPAFLQTKIGRMLVKWRLPY